MSRCFLYRSLFLHRPAELDELLRPPMTALKVQRLAKKMAAAAGGGGDAMAALQAKNEELTQRVAELEKKLAEAPKKK